jgi:hypothetical protein
LALIGARTAAAFEGGIPFIADGVIFDFVELAVVIEFFELGGDGHGRFGAIFFEQKDFAGEPDKDIEETGVFERVLGKFGFEALGIEVAQNLVIMAGDDLEGGFGQGGGLVVGDEFVGYLPIQLEHLKTFLDRDVAEVSSRTPAGEIHFVDGIGQRRIGGLSEGQEDFPVGMVIVHQGVDEVQESGGEFSDLAVQWFIAGIGSVGGRIWEKGDSRLGVLD